MTQTPQGVPAMTKPQDDEFKLNPLNPPIPRFCTQCGSPMVKGRVKAAAGSIDPATGQSTGTVEYEVKCEKLTSWRKIVTAYHDDYLFIDDPTSNNITGKPHRTRLMRS